MCFKKILTGTILIGVVGLGLYAQEEDYPLSEDSKQRAEGVVEGEKLQFEWNDSKIFPGTERKITVYVPRAYDGKRPACVAVMFDNGGYRFETVLDNLIHKGEIPVMIAVIVPPGVVPAAIDPSGRRSNRTFEYDTPDDRLARFILDEILPAVERLKTLDGRSIVLSKSGNDRMAAGNSSGAAAAFNMAWAMPEEFSRVFGSVVSLTGLRGSYIYSTLVHKTEPRALRLYFQSGRQDMWTSFGDWWAANNSMARALEFAGYDFRYALGEGKHSSKHGTSLFPDVMRYLWKDWPEPVKAGSNSRNHVLRGTIIPGEPWTAMPGVFDNACNLRADKTGQVYLSTEEGIFRVPDANGAAEFVGEGILWAFGPDGETRVVENEKGLFQVEAADAAKNELMHGLHVSALTVTPQGDVYAALSVSRDFQVSELYLLRAGQKPRLLDAGLKRVSALVLSSDGSWLTAHEHETTRAYSYRVETDASLSCKQSYYVLHKKDQEDAAHARDAVSDASEMGYQYVATDLGVQICDANGRTAAILPLPRNVEAISLCFGGADFKTLYVLGGDGKIYTRPMKQAGVPAFRPSVPIKTRAG